MKKVVKKIGNGLVIRIDAEDQEIYKIKEGDVLDIEWTKVKGKKNDILSHPKGWSILTEKN